MVRKGSMSKVNKEIKKSGQQAQNYSQVPTTNFAKDNVPQKPELSHDEVHEIYEEDVKTVYSSDQINTIGGTMGGTRGTFGSTRGDISGAPPGGGLPYNYEPETTEEDNEDMIDYKDFNK